MGAWLVFSFGKYAQLASALISTLGQRGYGCDQEATWPLPYFGSARASRASSSSHHVQIFFTSPLSIFFSTHRPVYIVSPTCNGHLGSGTDGSSCSVQWNQHPAGYTYIAAWLQSKQARPSRMNDSLDSTLTESQRYWQSSSHRRLYMRGLSSAVVEGSSGSCKHFACGIAVTSHLLAVGAEFHLQHRADGR